MRAQHLAHPRPPCPWCGASSSGITSARGDLVRAVYRRRRRCAECGKRWPTIEVLDVERFEREVRRLQIAPGDVGLDDKPADQARVRAYAERWAADVPRVVVEGVIASVGEELTREEAYDLLDTEQARRLLRP